ncbi:hypothetical protein QA414_21850 [Brucella intermedia]|nr:hypothetical protein [Brucella intermedia]WGG61329.1 hypothetical protein QA414_21850 [Brucella intermedia]
MKIETARLIAKNRRIVKAITQRIAPAGCFSVTFALQLGLHQTIATYRAFDSPLVNSKQADMRVLLILAGTNDNCRLFKRSDQKWIVTHDLSLVLTSDIGSVEGTAGELVKTGISPERQKNGNGQRGWKAQPCGGSTGEGASPLMPCLLTVGARRSGIEAING